MNDDNYIQCNFDTLVLSGGALKGIVSLGVVQYAIDNQYLNNVIHYCGTSSGAMICYLLAIGYTPQEIMVYICTHRIIEKMKNLNFAAVVDGTGVSSFNYIQEQLEKMTIDKIGKLITLGDLKSYGKTLSVVTYNITKGRVEYLTTDDTPEIPCIVALRMSSNIPLLFENFKYMDSYYVDGGIADNFPIDIAEKQGERILGIYLDYSSTNFINMEETNTISYILKLFNVVISRATHIRIEKSSKKCVFIRIDGKSPGTSVNFLNFNINAREKLDMFSGGYTTGKRFFEHDDSIS
jgi:NTE family protein